MSRPESRPDRCAHLDDAGAYVLHALSDDEARAYAAHLTGCAECQLEVAHLQLVVDTLPMSVTQVAPPPALKDRIMAVVTAESELLLAAGPQADRVPDASRRGRFALPSFDALRPAWVGALACGLLALGIAVGVLANGSGTPTERKIPGWAQGTATAKLDVTGDRGALEVVDLPSLSRGRVYQVWIDKGDGQLRPTHTLFNVRSDGRAKIAIDESLAGVKKILVTSEESGGALSPSGPPVVTAALA
jgi:anti-sigma-K factor RskA